MYIPYFDFVHTIGSVFFYFLRDIFQCMLLRNIPETSSAHQQHLSFGLAFHNHQQPHLLVEKLRQQNISLLLQILHWLNTLFGSSALLFPKWNKQRLGKQVEKQFSKALILAFSKSKITLHGLFCFINTHINMYEIVTGINRHRPVKIRTGRIANRCNAVPA